MSQEPPQFLPYETPTIPEKPACVPPIAIVGISLGGLTLLMRVFGLLGAIAMAMMVRRVAGMPQLGAEYQGFQIVSSLVFALFAALLLTASIGCLRMKEWGRLWLIRYAISYPVAMVLEIIGTVLFVMPTTTKFMKTASAGGPPPPAMAPAWMTGAMVGWLVFQMLVLMILPAFILVFLRKPVVKAAFLKS